MPQQPAKRYTLLRIDGRTEGPFTTTQLQSMCREGKCHADESIFDADTGGPSAAHRIERIEQLASLIPSQADAPGTPSGLNAAELTRKYRPAVIQIRTPTGTGTGFAIDPHGIVLTNLHVVEDSTKCELHLDDGRQSPARVVYRSDRTDLAVVLAATPTPNFICLSGSRGDCATVGDRAVALGFPLGQGFSVTEGILSAVGVRFSESERRVKYPGANHHWVRTSAQLNGGNSGGPIIDSAGRLVAMATWVDRVEDSGRSNEGMNYGLPHDVICEELREFRRRVHAGELKLPSPEDLVREGHRPDMFDELDLALRLVCKEFDFRIVEKRPFGDHPRGFAKAILARKPGDTLELYVDGFRNERGPLYLTMYCPLSDLPESLPTDRAARELLSANRDLPHWNFMLRERSVSLRYSRQLDLIDAREIFNVVEDLTIILNNLAT
jgi:serine protease Do